MLSIQHLHKTYRNGVQALDDVNLEIDKGMFGLLGPNGAGKSTLMRTIAGLQPADRGSIFFRGVDVTQGPQKLRSQLGYLPQEFGVYPHLSAVQLLDHLAVLKGIIDKQKRREQIQQLLGQTNLLEVQHRAVASFSGGMRQRFGIAQALLGNPRLVIVDEPTAGLDPEERNRLLDMLSEIGEEVVVLLSTHIVEDVRDLCSQMAVMHRGRVVLQGEPGALIQELQGHIWQAQIERREFTNWQERYQVISSRLFAGKTLIHVQADHSPGSPFEPVQPSLADVYFSTLRMNQQQEEGRL